MNEQVVGLHASNKFERKTPRSSFRSSLMVYVSQRFLFALLLYILCLLNPSFYDSYVTDNIDHSSSSAFIYKLLKDK